VSRCKSKEDHKNAKKVSMERTNDIKRSISWRNIDEVLSGKV
jgi:hypothetical protein